MIIIHLRVSDSQICGRATLQQRIAEFRLFHPEVSYLTQVNVFVFAWRHSENGYVACGACRQRIEHFLSRRQQTTVSVARIARKFAYREFPCS
ncbi:MULTISPECIES: hypothetical protein [Paraburkholderia]|uniref:Uncharacterized protein n=1 Tax=Paraburkholderia madseniana TaxID=2599607 RepID=A0AAP5EN06_9BURK|nr:MULTISPECIES: hypothetical protein [Paraburkholderia]MCX4145204.1 hypothetical protein [Paraburkholderia madseniana]MDN7148154.1 hypothetical protein [Paraburkholderia sp. WS6]MDQ6407034.1 hypothetical protein [Paraburkholderia madseniana]